VGALWKEGLEVQVQLSGANQNDKPKQPETRWLNQTEATTNRAGKTITFHTDLFFELSALSVELPT
jgi:hypothetical protein